MRRRVMLLVAAAVLAAALPAGTASAALRAGVAVADITPPNGGTTSGFVRPDVEAGKIAAVQWPPNIGVGGGRTPGPLGQGEFPP